MAGLKGSSLVETLVAAIIFISVFAASMEMLARITVFEESVEDVIIAELQMRRIFNKYINAAVGTTYTQEYTWGNVDVSVKSYCMSQRLNVISVYAHLKSGRILQYRRIVEYEY